MASEDGDESVESTSVQTRQSAATRGQEPDTETGDQVATQDVVRQESSRTNADSTTGHVNSGDDTTGRKSPKKVARLQTAVSIANVLVAIISIVAAIVAYQQVQAARQQNTIAAQQYQAAREQNSIASQQSVIALRQQLVSLAADIARAPAERVAAVAAHPNDQAGAQAAIDAINLAQDLQAKEAAAIVDSLPPDQVASSEYFIVARALEEASREFTAPLKYLDLAADRAKKTKDPRGLGAALRESAILYYRLHDPTSIAIAEQKMEAAKKIYDDIPNTIESDQKADLAYTLLLDSFYQVDINCQKAKEEFEQGQALAKSKDPLTMASGSRGLINDLPPLLAKC